jgi:hypothetical protein
MGRQPLSAAAGRLTDGKPCQPLAPDYRLADYSAAENAGMIGLNALSAAALVIFIGLMMSGSIAPAAKGQPSGKK